MVAAGRLHELARLSRVAPGWSTTAHADLHTLGRHVRTQTRHHRDTLVTEHDLASVDTATAVSGPRRPRWRHPMSRSTTRLAGALAASGLLVAALGGAVLAQSPSPVPGSGAPVLGTAEAPRVVVLSIGADKIEPATVEVVKGEIIKFLATNVSAAEVELIVGLKTDVDADAGDSLKEAEEIAPGADRHHRRLPVRPATAPTPTATSSPTTTQRAPRATSSWSTHSRRRSFRRLARRMRHASSWCPSAPTRSNPRPSRSSRARSSSSWPPTSAPPRSSSSWVSSPMSMPTLATASRRPRRSPPAQTGTIGAYPFTGDGPYAYGDQLPGHYAAGAKGDIVLVDALSN